MHGGKIILKKNRQRDNSEDYERAERAESKKINDAQIIELKAITESKKSGKGLHMKPLKFKY